MKNNFTPKIGIIIIVIFLVVAAMSMVSNSDKTTTITSSASESPKSNSTLAAKAESAGNIGEYYDGTKSATATSSATPIPTPGNIKQYTYPFAVTKSSAAKKLELETTASAEEVTEWYKEKIRSLGFNAKSFSQTTTNGEVLNKLSAAKPGEKIDITIKKDQSTSKILITVDRF